MTHVGCAAQRHTGRSGTPLRGPEYPYSPDSQAMYFKALGLQAFGGRQAQRLSEQGAAELLWGLLIAPLQR